MLKFPNIDPIAFSIGPIDVHWYGIAYLCGFAAAWWVAIRRAGYKHTIVRKEQIEDLVVYGALGVIVGGRLGYVFFYQFDTFLANPLWLFKVWEGGMSFHGGLLGVLAAMWIYARKHEMPFLGLMDFVAPAVPPGLFFGRLANFIGQELWGRETDGPWGMVFPKDELGLVRHPSQLYEALLEGLVLFIILYWFASKPRPRGAIGGLFLLLYGCFRFLVEFTREPDAHLRADLLLGWMTRGQLLSVPMIVVGAVFVVWAYRSPDARLGRY